MNLFTAAEATANYSSAGKKKTELPFGKMFVLAILAGFEIGVPAAVTQMASYAQTNNSVIRMISGILFAFGLGMVVITGSELFTGNTLISISVLDKKATVGGLLRNWIVVYIGNFVGSMVFSLLCAEFGWENAGDGALADFCMKVAQAKMTMPFQNAFVMGILCNMLVTLGVFISLQGQDGVSRFMGAWVPVMFFVVCGFNHSIADMTYCMLGLFAKGQFPDLAAKYPNLTWGRYFAGNMLSVTLGNIVGGVFIGWLLWYCWLRKPAKAN